MFTRLISLLKTLKPYWLNFPCSCLLCLAPIKQGKMAICNDCKIDLPTITQGCRCCGLPITHKGLCGQCLKSPPHFQRAIAPYRYDFPIAQLITRFKYQKQWSIGYLLASLLSEQLLQQYKQGLAKPNYLICVPLAKERLRQRSFNQAEMLAKWLSKVLDIPTQNDLLTRIINTEPQQQLSAKKRLQNLKNAFTIKLTTRIEGLHFAIVDDVITTGSTANVLANLLHSRGAKCVDIYAIARTPQRIK